MLKAVRGSYYNGIVELDEQPADVSEAQVIVTFLDTVQSDSKLILPDKILLGSLDSRGYSPGVFLFPLIPIQCARHWNNYVTSAQHPLIASRVCRMARKSRRPPGLVQIS